MANGRRHFAKVAGAMPGFYRPFNLPRLFGCRQMKFAGKSKRGKFI